MPYAGELAALGCTFLWTIGALCWRPAGRRIGSLTVNILRLVVAFILMCLYGWLMRGQVLPTDADGRTWALLLASGLVGFYLGDMCLFEAHVLVGPRITSLLMALAPPAAALSGWLLLGEQFGPIDLAGMVLTLSGVMWVVLERPRRHDGTRQSHPIWGVVLGLLAAGGQGVGLVLAKMGRGDYDAMAANQIRALAGIAGFAVTFLLLGWTGRIAHGVRDGRAMGLLTLGAITGPFAGVALLLWSTGRIPTGVAQTIVAAQPVLILPAVRWLYKERISLRAVLGAILAVIGVAILFLG